MHLMELRREKPENTDFQLIRKFRYTQNFQKTRKIPPIFRRMPGYLAKLEFQRKSALVYHILRWGNAIFLFRFRASSRVDIMERQAASGKCQTIRRTRLNDADDARD